MLKLFLSIIILLSSQDDKIQSDTVEITKEHIGGTACTFNETLEKIRFEIEKSSHPCQFEEILNETLSRIRNLNSHKFDNFTDALLMVRRSLISFYLRTNRYPLDLKEIQPEFLPFIPYVKIHSEYGNSIKYIRTNSYDNDYTKAVDSTTEYLYFADPKSSYWGFFIINSTSQYKSQPYYKY